MKGVLFITAHWIGNDREEGVLMKLYQNKAWLYQKYIIEKLSCLKIAKICEIKSHVTISVWLKKFDIKTRTVSEALSGMERSKEQCKRMGKSKEGKLNPMWKGDMMLDMPLSMFT